MDFGSLFVGLWCGGVFLFGVWWGKKSVRKELEKNAIPGYMEDGIVTLGVDQRAVPFWRRGEDGGLHNTGGRAMKKIMFNDQYGLTKLVVEGLKTMTRRIATYDEVFAPCEYLNQFEGSPRFGHTVLVDGCVGVATSQYKEGDIVAVAQSYKDALGFDGSEYWQRHSAGWTNKMYVKAELMPYRIRITKVSIQRLQDISDEDCLREGVINYTCNLYEFRGDCYSFYGDKAKIGTYLTARDAFAALIDKVSGKGTWAANPWVFVYSFELVV